MPIDNPADRGTEKDGALSAEFCKYCYKHGNLVEPDMTMEQMSTLVATQMKKMNLPEPIIRLSLKKLPMLKRWQEVHV